MKRKFLLYFFIFFISLILPLTIVQSANAKEYEISNYDIRIDLTEKGDYIITEKITYNFLEGEFSNAYREIKDESLKNLEFISLDGVFTGITSKRIVEDSNGLKINWSYPETDNNAEFVLKYRAKQALASKNNKNVMNYIIEKGWDVPLRDLDISIYFPKNVSGISVEPENDLIRKNDSMVKLHHEYLSANSGYNLDVKFDKIIDTNYPKIRSPYFYPLIIGLIAGIIVIIFTLIQGYKKRPAPKQTESNIHDFNFIELGSIYYPKSSEKRRGIIGAIFVLAQKGKIKLISKLDSGLFGSKKVDIQVEFLSDKNLSESEKELFKALKKERNLKKFLQKQKYTKDSMKLAREKLKEQGLFNKKGSGSRVSSIFIGVLTLILGIAGLLIGPFVEIPLIMGMGLFLVLFGVSRFIKSAFIPMLSSEGMGLRNDIEGLLEEKKVKFENVLEENPNIAITLFFEELPYLILHKKFNSYTFKKYKKELKKADKFVKPQWIKFDLSELDKTLDALDVVEVIDYLMISTIFIVSSTAGTTGIGGSGGGSAGGGGAS